METSSPPTIEALEADLRTLVPDAVAETVDNRGQLIVRTSAAQRVDVLRALKGLGFTHYIFCSAVDWPDDERLEILDHVYSIQRRQRVTVTCDLPYAEPRVASATPVYAGADWHERETWELFGVFFSGHPKLARLLLPDWFEGYPMRKSFVLAPRVEKPWPGEFFEG